jgi:hypothetical protein
MLHKDPLDGSMDSGPDYTWPIDNNFDNSSGNSMFDLFKKRDFEEPTTDDVDFLISELEKEEH